MAADRPGNPAGPAAPGHPAADHGTHPVGGTRALARPAAVPPAGVHRSGAGRVRHSGAVGDTAHPGGTGHARDAALAHARSPALGLPVVPVPVPDALILGRSIPAGAAGREQQPHALIFRRAALCAGLDRPVTAPVR
ncbi:hypothetical protein [Streptomyces sp. cmx-4-9]|uniref:hypothetical protein n=1 Tax=Streptomyces sp. cmx-4-9 TaxID=2790941 RepID=UPI0039810D25